MASPHFYQAASCEKVAAVCYRVHSRAIQFLLVQTGAGRWTFPKGSLERGLTQAQAAALEAVEEAGVHGRMEITAFARYLHKGGKRQQTVDAYLCRVSRLDAPQEDGRNPTWFSVTDAKRRLRDKRTSRSAGELLRVVEAAVARIRTPETQPPSAEESGAPRRDALRTVQFEADAQGPPASRLRLYRRQIVRIAEIEGEPRPARILQLTPPRKG